MDIQLLENKLSTYDIKFFDVLDSTHRYIKSNREKLDKRTIVIADIQENGIGTHGRKWYINTNSNITMSILYKLNTHISNFENLTINIAKCIKEVLKEKYDINLEIKKPNDLLLNNKKICGILTEINTIHESVNYLIISIGFNVNEENFDKKIENIATSLKKEYGKKFNKEELIIYFVEKIDKQIISNLTGQNNEKINKA